MTYADPPQRRDLIHGLRMLADLLESCPEIPAPYATEVLVFPPDGPDEDICAEIDRIAVLIGTEPHDQIAMSVIQNQACRKHRRRSDA